MSEFVRYRTLDGQSIKTTALSSAIGSISNSLLGVASSGTLIVTGSAVANASTLGSLVATSITGSASATAQSVVATDSSLQNLFSSTSTMTSLLASGLVSTNYTVPSLVVTDGTVQNSVSTSHTAAGLVIQTQLNSQNATHTNSIVGVSSIATLRVSGSCSSASLFADAIVATVATTGNTQFANYTVPTSVITRATTNTLVSTPNVVSCTIGGTLLTDSSTVTNLVSNSMSGGQMLISDARISGTVENLLVSTVSTVSSSRITNASMGTIRADTNLTAGSIVTPNYYLQYNASLRIGATVGNTSQYSIFFSRFTNRFIIVDARTKNSMWGASSSGSIYVGAMQTLGSTMIVECSSGGNNALVTVGGVLRISNSSNAVDSSNGGSFTARGGAAVTRDFIIGGSLTKGSGTFDIPHPDPVKPKSRLRHSFVESPTCGDNIYRYTVDAPGTVLLPDYFFHLNENVSVYVRPVGHFGIGYGTWDGGNSIAVACNTPGKYNVLVIGTRKDSTAKDNWEGRGTEYHV